VSTTVPRSPTRANPGINQVAIFLAGVIVFGTLVIARPNALVVIVFAAVNSAAFAVARGRLRPIALSPPAILSAYITIVTIAGFLLGNSLVGSGGTGGIDSPLPLDLFASTAIWMLAASTLILIGAMLAAGRSTDQSKDIGRALITSLDQVSRLAGPLLVLAVLHIATLIAFLGLGPLLERPNRLIGRSSTLEGALGMLAVGMVLVVGIVFFTKSGPVRAAAAVILSAYALYFFSLGSRRLAVVPVLLLLANILARRGRAQWWKVASIIALSPAILSLPLFLRGSPTHGLRPYFAALPEFVFTGGNYATSLNNILAGFKITALSGFPQGQIPIEWFYISVNPETGVSAGWYEIARRMRINQNTPYSGLGEIISQGFLVFVIMMLALGFVLGLVHRVNRYLLTHPRAKYVAMATLGLTLVLTVQFLQYNLRSNMRYLYLILLLQGAALITVKIYSERGKQDRK